jgi:hypothetical protein
MNKRFATVLVFLAAAAAARGADPAPVKRTPKPTPTGSSEKPCTAPEFHQFDFWIGDWDVRSADGKPAGTNHVESILGGCALQESWKSATGGRGTSLNVYDEPSRKWHQSWVDDSGGLLLLDGEFRDDKMVLVGRRPSVKQRGGLLIHRITWTVVSPDRVLQRWEASNNEGRTWTTVFDGTYVRKK